MTYGNNEHTNRKQRFGNLRESNNKKRFRDAQKKQTHEVQINTRSVSVEATETVATDFVRLGDEGECARIRLGDDVFDLVDLTF